MSKPVVITAEPVVNQDECRGLSAELGKAVDEGARLVVVDCSDCRYLNSLAISEIMSAHVRLSARGGRLNVCGVHGFVKQCLDSVGALSMLHLYDSAEAAGALEETREGEPSGPDGAGGGEQNG